MNRVQQATVYVIVAIVLFQGWAISRLQDRLNALQDAFVEFRNERQSN